MNSDLYFPSLKRQSIESYFKRPGKFYATYNSQKNYENISKDCQYRCVYCDVHIDECGGEPFSLDHFRPVGVFGNKFDGILKVHPYNLHLSCQKCNILKTNDWQGCRSTQGGPTFLSSKGYIDRFQVDITDYLKVDDEGRIQCINSVGPARYMIGKMLLNRTNRVYIRKKREVKIKADRIGSMLVKRKRLIVDRWLAGDLAEDEVKKEMENLIELFERFDALSLIKL